MAAAEDAVEDAQATNAGDQAGESYDYSEMQLAVFEGQEAMLCELLRRSHESAAHKIRLAVNQKSVAGVCKAQRDHEAQLDMARHLQETFELESIA